VRHQCQQYLTDQSQGRIAKKIGRQKFVQVGNQQLIGRQNRARKNRPIFDVTRPTFCRPINRPIYRPTKSRSSDIGFMCIA